jgi:hypothetical protein
MRWKLAVIALGLLAAAACARRRADTILDRIEQDPDQLVNQVAVLRGLRNRRPVRFHFHHEARFLNLLRARGGLASGGLDSAESWPWRRALSVGAGARRRAATVQRVYREQVAAFYDATEHAIHVRRRPLATDGGEETALWAVVHEIGHALQHQNFTIPDLRQIQCDDERLAVLAMLEGDAMLTMLAYVAHQQFVPLRRALVRVRQRVERGDFEQAIRLSNTSPELMRAGPVLRQRLIFPYAFGTTFLGTIHRAGGFALVNRVYEHPPTSTEHILHPKTYLAGDQPVGVAEPPAPPGYRRRAAGRMGELQIRVLLEQCLPRPVAWAAAQGWAGDAFGWFRSGRARQALLWSTVWDSDVDAMQFTKALGESAACWARADVQQEAPGTLYGLRREGRKVVFSSGLKGPLRDRLLSTMLAEPATRLPRRPPLGRVVIAPIKPVASGLPPRIAGGHYVDQRLGIRLPIPAGYSAKLQQGLLVIVRPGRAPASGSVALSELAVTTASVEKQWKDFQAGFEQSGDGEAELEQLETGRVRTPLGDALARTWKLGGEATRLRVTILPICGGTGSLAISQLWSDQSGAAELKWWLGQLSRLRPGPPPVCAELDP